MPITSRASAGTRLPIKGADGTLSLSQLFSVEFPPLFGVPECGCSAGLG